MRREKGITLIALVITIIVLLILAGVSINMIASDDGIVQQAAKSKAQYNVAEEKESIELAYDTCKLDNIGETVDAEDLQTQLSKTYGEKVNVVQRGEKIKITFTDSGNTYIFDGQSVEENDSTKTEIAIGQAVNYDVTYTDANKSTVTFDENNGWRLLSYKANEDNPELYDIEIISTGVPVGIHYHYNIKSNPTIAGGWCATDDQISSYIEEFYSSATATDNNMYAAAGLYYNFEKLVFQNKTITAMKSENIKHYGCYLNVNGVTGQNITGDIFRSTNENIKDKITGIRNITLADITGKNDETTTVTDVDGLFLLGKLKTSEFATKHGLTDYSGYNMYWVASPVSTSAKSLYWMVSGGLTSSTGDPYGLRPIISIEGVNMDLVDDIIYID